MVALSPTSGPVRESSACRSYTSVKARYEKTQNPSEQTTNIIEFMADVIFYNKYNINIVLI